tara:strand:+ start:382 stop:954 length:573 start_codon:yes stop_codon:yes gene_type:complete
MKTTTKAKSTTKPATVETIKVPSDFNGQPYATSSNGAFNVQLQSFLNANNVVGGIGALTVSPNLQLINLESSNPLPLSSKISNTGKRAKGIFFLLFGCPIVNGAPYSIKHPDFGKYGYICPAEWSKGEHQATDGKKGEVSFNLADCLNANRTTGLTDNASLIVGLLLNGGNAKNTSGAPLIHLTVTPKVK